MFFRVIVFFIVFQAASFVFAQAKTVTRKSPSVKVMRSIASEDETKGNNSFRWVGYCFILGLPLVVGYLLTKKDKYNP